MHKHWMFDPFLLGMPAFFFDKDEGAAAPAATEPAPKEEGAPNPLAGVQAQLDRMAETDQRIASAIEQMIAAGAKADKDEDPEEERPALDLSDLPDPYSDKTGWEQAMAAKLTESMGVTAQRAQQIVETSLQRFEAKVRDDVDAQLDRRDVGRRNMDGLKQYFKDHSVPAKAQKEIVEVVKGLPWNSRYGERHGKDLFLYSADAFKAADMAVRGAEVVAAAEARVKEETLREMRAKGDFTEFFGDGAGTADLAGMTDLERIEYLGNLPQQAMEEILYNEELLSDDKLIGMVRSGQDEFMRQRNRGYAPAGRR